MKNGVLAAFVPELAVNEEGAAASEYAITVAGVAVVIAAAVFELDLNGVFPAVVAKIAGLIG